MKRLNLVRTVSLPLLLVALVGWLVAGELVMDPAYVNFFGLSADAGAQDTDDDGLTNHDESLLWTDPFMADTDHDGFPDGMDDNPVSRANVPWGNPFFTHPDDSVLYTWPDWMEAAWAEGGQWITNLPSAWHSPTGEVSASLNHLMDRGGIASNLAFRIEYLDHTASALHVDLFSTNGTIIASDLFGDITEGQGGDAVSILEIPFSAHPDAVGIQLRKAQGEATVYRSLLYVDSDMDGLDDAQEQQLGTNPTNPDSDGDGLTDGEEAFIYGTDPTNADTSGDGISDGHAVTLGLNPTQPTLYALLPFLEGFEPPERATGPLAGQGKWQVSLSATALVQTRHVFAGELALQIDTFETSSPATLVQQDFIDAPSVVWTDMHLRVRRAPLPETDSQAAAEFLFNADGQLVVHDGLQPAGSRWVTLTNAAALAQGEWARVSVRADYTAQTWLVCLNGQLIASNLGFASPQSRLHALSIQGRLAHFDNIYVGADQPDGLSTVAGNIIPDEWYTNHFGHLQYSDHDDPDADGLTNLEEYHLGTDPTNPDTDEDGFSDGHEDAIGSDPLDPLSYPVTLSGQITYAGTQAGTVHLQITSAQGPRLHTFPLAGTVMDYTVPDLISCNDYSVTAFLDTTGDGVQHPWEPIGNYMANPIRNLTNNLSGIDITLVEDTGIDTDGDGMSDYDEVYVHGSNPYIFNTTPANVAVLTRQVWYGITGTAVSELTGDPRYPFDPEEEHPLAPIFEAPGSVANYYGQRILGRFRAPRTGDYTFWIASKDNGELLLTGTNGTRQIIASVPGSTNPRQWTKYASQQSSPIHLEAGQVYPMEALMNEYIGGDHLAVGIQFPDGRLERPMRTRWFSAPPPEIDLLADSDGDGLTGYEEWVYGSDPNSTDTTGDGLSDSQKALLGLDPARVDTIGDGLPDWWVVENNLDTTMPEADNDPDGDSLTNLQEYRAGTDPNDPDTDGDGIDDFSEVMLFDSNPLAVDHDATRSILVSKSGSKADFTQSYGFTVSGNTAQSTGYGGQLTYHLDIVTNGHHALVFTLEDPYGFADNPIYAFRLWVDGVETGVHRSILMPGDQPRELIWVPAPLSVGQHEITLRWDYKPLNGMIRVEKLELVSFGGPDNIGDGKADWISYRTTKQPEMVSPPATNWVSPLCLEGNLQRYGDVSVTLTNGGANSVLAVNRAPGTRWYTDVPLLHGEDTSVRVDWEDGGAWTTTVAWAEYNLLAETPNIFTIREGDSLLLNAHPQDATSGSGTIHVAGDTVDYAVGPGAPLSYTFSTAGQYQVTGTWADGTSRTTSVSVVGGSFADTPALWIRRTRTWDNADLPDGLVYEGEYQMRIKDQEPLAAGGRRLELYAHTEGTGYVLARLSQGGPILASSRVESFTNYSSWQVHIHHIETLSDGTRLISLGVVGQFPLEDIRVRIKLHGGSVFETGGTILDLTRDDFDQAGYAGIRLYLAPNANICHFLNIYQGDTWIGSR